MDTRDMDHEAMERRLAGGGGGAVVWLFGLIGLAILAGGLVCLVRSLL